MDLLHLDITPPDIASLGLVAQRVWSPHLLGLCLPSWPQQAHPRFSAYGGAAGTTPHPHP